MKSHVGVQIEPSVEEYCTKPEFDADGVQVSSGIGPDGKEYPDPVPMSAEIGYEPPPDLMTMIRTMVHSEAAKHVLQQAGIETIDEADDFDIEDDPLDPLTPYEAVFMPKAPPPTVEKVPVPSPVPEPSQKVVQGEGAVASPPPGNVAVQQK